jgi:Mg2+ and Co2+ transporter CorA
MRTFDSEARAELCKCTGVDEDMLAWSIKNANSTAQENEAHCLGLVLCQLLMDSNEDDDENFFIPHKIAIFFLPASNCIVSIQHKTDCFDDIRDMFNEHTSMLHKHPTASFLLDLLLDALIDNCEPILDTYGEALDGLEYVMSHQVRCGCCQHLRSATFMFFLFPT